jgi:hypothetical protein
VVWLAAGDSPGAASDDTDLEGFEVFC